MPLKPEPSHNPTNCRSSAAQVICQLSPRPTFNTAVSSSRWMPTILTAPSSERQARGSPANNIAASVVSLAFNAGCLAVPARRCTPAPRHGADATKKVRFHYRILTSARPTARLLQSITDPYVVYASIVIAAIPTLLIFLFCQNIIMRGIVVPVEK